MYKLLNTTLVLAIALLCIASEAKAVDDLAVKEALRVFVDRFNTKDNLSIVGDVDYEYVYISEKVKRPDIFPAERLAGLIEEPVVAPVDTSKALGAGEREVPLKPSQVRTPEQALSILPQAIKDTLIGDETDEVKIRRALEGLGFRFDEPKVEKEPLKPVVKPDLLGENIAELVGRNKGKAVEKDARLSLRKPPRADHIYRRDITTAAQDYSMKERRLLRWDLNHLFQEIPAEVILKIDPKNISVRGNSATLEVAYSFDLDVETERGEPYKEKSGELTLTLRKVGQEWMVNDVKDFVGHLRLAVLE